MRLNTPKIGIGRLVMFIALGVCATVAGVLFQQWYRAKHQAILSPISTSTVFRFLNDLEDMTTHENRLVYGYLPYWNLQKITLQPELDTLAYFGLVIGSDGSIVTRIEGSGEPGYQKWNSDAALPLINQQIQKGGKIDLVLAQFDADAIAAFLNNPNAQTKLLTNLDSVLLSSPVQGINIDIEYSGNNSQALQPKMTAFIAYLDKHLAQKYPHIKLSIAVYASAATRPQIWDIPGLSPNIDYFVVMAYDFHRRSSPVAGPVAPIFGGKELWDSDISTHLKDFLKVTSKEKLLLGVPFYGYEWQTTDRQPQAHTFPETGATASFERVQEILAKRDELKVEEGWNEKALSPYITYQEKNNIYVIYYENSRSLSYKLDLVNQLDLAGMAIWALGYEGQNRELWDVIARKAQ